MELIKGQRDSSLGRVGGRVGEEEEEDGGMERWRGRG